MIIRWPRLTDDAMFHWTRALGPSGSRLEDAGSTAGQTVEVFISGRVMICEARRVKIDVLIAISGRIYGGSKVIG